MRPRIGVTTSRGRGRLMWWFNRIALWRAGGRAVRLSAGSPVDPDGLHALVIGGGDDIDAVLYGAAIEPAVRIDRARDTYELALIGRAVARGLPMLGICRGAQMLNVFLGGSLHADIHDTYGDAPRLRTALPRKTVSIEPGSRLHRLLQRRQDRVNALHHQSVDRLGRGLAVVARDAHGIVQAVERPEPPFLIGVQWHPEFMVFDPGQQRLFRGLVAAAKAAAQQAAIAADAALTPASRKPCGEPQQRAVP